MTVERRLQHAARELRELDVPVPPLPGVPGRTPAQRALPVVAAVAVVLAGFAAIVSLAPGTSSSGTVAEPVAALPVDVGTGGTDDPPLIDPRAEVALITSLTDGTNGDGTAVRPVPPGVV